MINETRSAEFGGEIITDTAAHTFSRVAIAIKVLEDATFTSITSASRKPVSGLDAYYAGRQIFAGETIEGNLKGLQLSEGAVQVFYAA